ncbi:MAG: NYN domain-containing protein [Polyangia bacterium]
MDRTAVFVDAGYLFAAGSKLIAGEKLPRGELDLKHDVVIGFLTGLARELTGLPLLRIYWYDGTAIGPTPQQLALAYRPNVKLRLGFVNQHGQQKGVDSLIVTDMINLARNLAMAAAVLLTGDEDIRVGVQQAQEFGVLVHLLGIEPARDNQSGFLVQEADNVREISRSEIQSFLSRTRAAEREPDAAAIVVAPHEGERVSLADVAKTVAAELRPEEIEAVLLEAAAGGSGSVPSAVDRRLLVAGSAALDGAQLTSSEKRQLRTAFLDACRTAPAKQ